MPAVLDAVVTALDRFGTKSLAEVMQPAIELADGFPIDELRVSYIERTRKIFEPWPSSAKVFLPNGRVPKPGEIFSQPDLARTLREIVTAERAPRRAGVTPALMAARDYFYKGAIAKRISDFSEANGGLLRAGGFRGVSRQRSKNRRRQPIAAMKSTRPASGRKGRRCSRLLNMLEGYDLRAMKHNSADYIHTLIEAMKLAFADRDQYLWRPGFCAGARRRAVIKGVRGDAPHFD